MSFVVATFYKFFPWPDFEGQRQPLLDVCNGHDVKGTILIAHEGLNATICGTEQGVTEVKNFLESLPEVGEIRFKYSDASDSAFGKMKVKIKPEIVTIGLPEIDPTAAVGTYVQPKDWDDLIEDPDVLVIDTRNDYEYQIGTFKNAVNPQTEVFREFPEYVSSQLDPEKHKKVALFCTGGIRCEKASSYMKEAGFEDVYHLEGGIIKYLEEVPAEKSSWDGQCYVFDDRVTLRHGLVEGDHIKCGNCGMPMPPEEATSEKYEPEISCPKCFDELTPERRRRREMKRNHLLAKASTQ